MLKLVSFLALTLVVYCIPVPDESSQASQVEVSTFPAETQAEVTQDGTVPVAVTSIADNSATDPNGLSQKVTYNLQTTPSVINTEKSQAIDAASVKESNLTSAVIAPNENNAQNSVYAPIATENPAYNSYVSEATSTAAANGSNLPAVEKRSSSQENANEEANITSSVMATTNVPSNSMASNDAVVTSIPDSESFSDSRVNTDLPISKDNMHPAETLVTEKPASFVVYSTSVPSYSSSPLQTTESILKKADKQPQPDLSKILLKLFQKQ